MSEHQEILTINNMRYDFPNSPGNTDLRVLNDISLTIYQGEFICIVGPSGCGKTTLLNVMAGFIHGYEGDVTCLGQPITAPSPERAMVFQSAALFPWLTVTDNIAYGLNRAGWKKAAINDMVKEYLTLVEMEGFEDFYPGQLSGGMQQRVALARVLVLNPKILLMDEPFAALDAQTRLTMQELLMKITLHHATTVVFVTHDVEEAVFLSDRIHVMSNLPGRLIREIDVPLARPRLFPVRNSSSFITLKAEILELLFKQSQDDSTKQLRLIK